MNFWCIALWRSVGVGAALTFFTILHYNTIEGAIVLLQLVQYYCRCKTTLYSIRILVWVQNYTILHQNTCVGAPQCGTVGAARAEVGLPLVSVFCFCFCLIADHCARLKETYSLYYRGRERRRMMTTAWNKSMEQNAKSNTSTSKPKLWIQPYMKMYILQPNCAIFPIWN